ncbi:PREDICTED: probable carboxylesterase 16 [Camelina sativa]|uniref:Probable carboxylesterase 16 n=1 Tax=Camelina sativa TaxID=90675 RepID=A0ABM0TCA8_CAMSA|nr:PREDICTED: probable carboxylesterase 16 [Camelina sativa]
MPGVAVKLYSVFFKLLLKHRLQNLISISSSSSDKDGLPDSFGVSTRSDESVAAANPSFTDGVATKDIHIDPMTSLTVRIFLPESALSPPEPDSLSRHKDTYHNNNNQQPRSDRRHSYGPNQNSPAPAERNESRRSSYGCNNENLETYGGYAPSAKRNSRKLPVMLQFHGGGWVSGSSDSAANDFFCRRIAKVCDVIVLAVGYRLAPENRYPAAFEDGVKVLHWLGKQANLADCCKSLGNRRVNGVEVKKLSVQGQIVDAFGASMVEPWLAAHADPSRFTEARIRFDSDCYSDVNTCLQRLLPGI